MKIFYYAHLDLSGGGSIGSIRHVVEVVNRLSDRGHCVTMFVPRPSGELPELRADRIVEFEEGEGYSGFLAGVSRCFVAMVGEIARTNRPDCFYVREMLYTFHTALLGFVLGIPHVTEVNGFQPEEVRTDPHFEGWLYPLLLVTEALNYGLSTRLLSVSGETAAKIRAFYRLPPTKVLTVRNGVNTRHCRPMDREECRRRVGIDPSCRVAGFVGYFFPWSGVDHIIRAAPAVLDAVPDACFLIVGSGQWGTHLRNLAEQHGVRGAFRFTGEVPWEEVPLYLNCMDVGLSPYDRREGLGDSLKTYEYMACGLPVIVANVPRVNRIVRRHDCGLVFEPEREDLLARRILDLFEDAARRSRMGKRARKAAVEHYGWGATVRKIETLLANLPG